MVHTGLTASTMNVKCHTKHENRRSLYCSSSSHQKSVSADDKSKHNKPSPSITRTNLLTLALYMSHSGVKCHTKHENRRSLYCSSSSHQKSVSADDKSKHKPSHSITRTNLLTLALYMSHSGGSFGYRCIAVTATHAVCVFVVFYYFHAFIMNNSKHRVLRIEPSRSTQFAS